jgi:hypothetical protein
MVIRLSVKRRKNCGNVYMECTLVASRATRILDPEEGVKLVGERLDRLAKDGMKLLQRRPPLVQVVKMPPTR